MTHARLIALTAQMRIAQIALDQMFSIFAEMIENSEIEIPETIEKSDLKRETRQTK